jgi:hypothetical protein
MRARRNTRKVAFASVASFIVVCWVIFDAVQNVEVS